VALYIYSVGGLAPVELVKKPIRVLYPRYRGLSVTVQKNWIQPSSL
jgi:hypothetical protein